jgi:hypothetical protein
VVPNKKTGVNDRFLIETIVRNVIRKLKKMTSNSQLTLRLNNFTFDC